MQLERGDARSALGERHQRPVRIPAGRASLDGDLVRPNDAHGVVQGAQGGGRPDLAGPVLDRAQDPTLLVVGGDDVPVIEMNRTAPAYLLEATDRRYDVERVALQYE